PLRVYRVLGESRSEVVRAGSVRDMVGRQREIESLRERWQQVKQGAGQVVLLSGEAGIGKSRLVDPLREYVAREPHALLECRCSPYYQHTALYPVIDLFQRLLGWRREDSPLERLEKLEALLAPYDVRLPEAVPLLASLLALPLPEGRYRPLALSP